MIKTVVLTTGDELLHGTTIDTNSSYISRMLFGTDLSVIRHITVGDDVDSISAAISESMYYADLIIITGGLGPTDDDNTVEAVSRISGLNIVHEECALARISDFFKSMNIKINEKDFKMAAVPEGAVILNNIKGLSPGFAIEFKGKIIVVLPGVPAEAETMFDGEVIPFLNKRLGFHTGNRILFRVTGIRESDINTRINALELPEYIQWGVSAKHGVCDLFFMSHHQEFPDKNIIENTLKSEFSRFMLGDEFSSPEKDLVYLLRDKGYSISTAESCTGGLIGKRITDIAGSSDVYAGTVTAYSNSIKTGILGVKEKTLEKFGAVSEEVAQEMASGIKNLFQTDIGVSVTGIAGPGGGSPEKPVGTVCFGFFINNQLVSKRKLFRGDRDRVRIFSSLYAINFIREHLPGRQI